MEAYREKAEGTAFQRRGKIRVGRALLFFFCCSSGISLGHPVINKMSATGGKTVSFDNNFDGFNGQGNLKRVCLNAGNK